MKTDDVANQMPFERVEIVMLATPETRDYSWLGRASWQNYADRHGHDFRVCEDKVVPDMHVNWSKIELVRRRLAETSAQVLLLVDADSFVFIPDQTLENLWHPNRSIMFANDCSFPRPGRLQIGRRHLLRLRLGQWNLPNAGFMMVQVEDYTRRFFDRWLDLARHELKHWANVHPRNQNVLWRGLLRSEKSQIGILDKQVIRMTHPSQIRHLPDLKPFAVHYKHEAITASQLHKVVPALDGDCGHHNLTIEVR